MRTIFFFGIVLGLAVFNSCGSDSGPAKQIGLRDGRIFLENTSPYIVDASYFNEELGLVETAVEAGEMEDVSKAMLKGGTKVALTISCRKSHKPVKKIEVLVDGNVTVRVTLCGDAGRLEYELR